MQEASANQCLSIKQAEECRLNIYSEKCFEPFLECFDGLYGFEQLSELNDRMNSIKTVFDFEKDLQVPFTDVFVPVQRMELDFNIQKFIRNVEYFAMVPIQAIMWPLFVIPNMHFEKYSQDTVEPDLKGWFTRFIDQQISIQQFLTFRWQVAELGTLDQILEQWKEDRYSKLLSRAGLMSELSNSNIIIEEHSWNLLKELSLWFVQTLTPTGLAYNPW